MYDISTVYIEYKLAKICNIANKYGGFYIFLGYPVHSLWYPQNTGIFGTIRRTKTRTRR